VGRAGALDPARNHEDQRLTGGMTMPTSGVKKGSKRERRR
jgi:hypothetical protein